MIHLLVEDSHVFLAEQVGAHDMETSTLFCELHTALRAEVLQCDILRENTRNAESIPREYARTVNQNTYL